MIFEYDTKMNVKLIIFLSTWFKAAQLQKDPLSSILEPNSNCFHIIYFNIHIITNTLLSSLNVKQEFTQSNNIATMLAMHDNFKKIAEQNCRIYAELRKTSVASFGEGDSNIHETIENVVKDEIDKLKTAINTPEDEDNELEFSNPEDIVEGFNEFLTKHSDMTMESLIDSIININEGARKNSTPKTRRRHELKVWKPRLEASTLKLTNHTRRIYKGRKSRIEDYPFLASLHKMNEFLCIGSIISIDMIITAASCLQGADNNKIHDNPRTLFVRVGSDYTKRYGELIPIAQVIIHPNYDAVTLNNNLAIVKMLVKLSAANTRIKRIRLEKSPYPLDGGVGYVSVLGWGAIDEKGKPNNLQKLAVTKLDIYNINDCTEIYSKYYVTKWNFCAGYVNKGGGACMGDVGGPAVASGELVGIISFGPTVCGSKGAPTVFTKVGFYAQWIREVINQS